MVKRSMVGWGVSEHPPDRLENCRTSAVTHLKPAVDSGSQFVARQDFAKQLTSRQLKVKPKANNIAGLQIADVIAHPSYRATLARHEQQPLPPNFGGKIAEILENVKYDRDHRGAIEGWGRKWLP